MACVPKTVWQRGSDARLCGSLAHSTERSSALDAFVSATPGTNALRGALARSLQSNPYEFFDATWLGRVVRQVVQHTNKRSRATTKNGSGAPRVSVLLNLRMRVEAHSETFGAQEAGVVLESGQMHGACGADHERKLALITLVLRPTDEALLARQLRSRALPLGASARFALRADQLPEPQQPLRYRSANDDTSGEDCAIRNIFIAEHGKNGDKVHNALCMQPTVRIMLAYELAQRASTASHQRLVQRKLSASHDQQPFVVADEDASASSSGLAGLGTDSSAESDSELSSSDEAEEVRESEAEREAGSASSEPSGISLDATDSEDETSSDDEADDSDAGDAALSADSDSKSLDLRTRVGVLFSESYDDEPHSAHNTPAPTPSASLSLESVVLEEDTAEHDEAWRSDDIEPRDTRFNEFMWLRALVHQRSFTLGFELTHQSPYAQYRQQLRRIEVPQTALPTSLEAQLALPEHDSDEFDTPATIFLYVGRAAQLRAKQRGTRLLRWVAAPVVVHEPAVAAAPTIVDAFGERDAQHSAPESRGNTLLDQLAAIDLSKITLYEMEVYARARLEALLVLFCGLDATHQSRRYPQQSGAERNTLAALAGAPEREAAHQSIGLLVMLLAAAHSEQLLANLYALEKIGRAHV